MADQVVQDFAKIVDTFAEMRKKMRDSQKYSGKDRRVATDKFYEAMRQFAYEIGLMPPFIPLDDDDDLVASRG
jgi:hypothetical protein